MTTPILIVEDDDLKGKTLERFIRVIGDREVLRVETLTQAIFMLKGRPLAVITDWEFPLHHGKPPTGNGRVVVGLCHSLGIPCLVNSGHDPVDDLPEGILWPDIAGTDFNEVLKSFLEGLPRERA